MQLDKLCVACFSPTHTSMKIARAIADGTHIARREEIDLTTDPADTPIAVRNAICIVAAPVYGGLVAPVAVRRIARLRAETASPFRWWSMATATTRMPWYSFATSWHAQGLRRPPAVRLSWANTPTAVRACP